MMETKKFKLEILRCNNGLLIDTKTGKFVFKDGADFLQQMGEEIERLNPGEKMIIEYSKDGTENKH